MPSTPNSPDADRLILLIDNYDSFVHNLARYFERLGAQTATIRNNATAVDTIRDMQPAAIVLSPGPCTPAEAGIGMELVKTLTGEIPILGICLGHQTIVAAFGGTVLPSPRPVHGQATSIAHEGTGIFHQIPSPCEVGRYHSLHTPAESLPTCLDVIAEGDDLVMAVAHRSALVIGLQFHPESILSPDGYRMLANFLQLAGVGNSVDPASLWASEFRGNPSPHWNHH